MDLMLLLGLMTKPLQLYLLVLPQKTSITEGKHCVTVASLFEQYEQENAQNWKPATLRENKASHAALIEVF